jgi:hypothetical protein
MCLLPLIIHLFIYYLYHTIYDGIYRHKKYISGLSVWIESHNNISIFRISLFGEMLLERDQTNFIENKMKACN